MVEFSIGSKKDFVVTSIRRGRVNDIRETVVDDVPEVLGDPLAWIPRLGSVTPLEWDAAYGLGDDPADEYLEWFLVAVDVDNLPTLESVRALSIWWRPQAWRSIGTDSGPVQTMVHDTIDFFNPETYSFQETADFTQRYAVCVVINSDQDQSDMRTVGVLTYQETLIQRVFGSDNWTFEDPDNSEFGAEWGDDASCDASSS